MELAFEEASISDRGSSDAENEKEIQINKKRCEKMKKILVTLMVLVLAMGMVFAAEAKQNDRTTVQTQDNSNWVGVGAADGSPSLESKTAELKFTVTFNVPERYVLGFSNSIAGVNDAITALGKISPDAAGEAGIRNSRDNGNQEKNWNTIEASVKEHTPKITMESEYDKGIATLKDTGAGSTNLHAVWAIRSNYRYKVFLTPSQMFNSEATPDNNGVASLPYEFNVVDSTASNNKYTVDRAGTIYTDGSWDESGFDITGTASVSNILLGNKTAEIDAPGSDTTNTIFAGGTNEITNFKAYITSMEHNGSYTATFKLSLVNY